MAELALERFELALEATRGTAVTPPTHVINMEGNIVPTMTHTEGTEMRGTLAEGYRTEITRTGSTWDMSGDADANTAPVLANMAVKGGVTSPTTPSGATNARLWTFSRDMTSDSLKSATLYHGDPGINMLQAAYAMAEEMTLSADSSSEDLVQMGLTGSAQFPAKVSPPTAPAAISGRGLIPGLTDLYIDTSSAIGTTAITGRLVSADVSIPTGVVYKYLANGGAGTLGFSKIGRTRTRPSFTLTFELTDYTQYDLFTAGTLLKMRLRFNSAADLIESGYNNYIEIDTWGVLRDLSWGDLEGANRTVSFTLLGTYDSTAATDLIMKIQNAKTTL